MRKGCKPLKSSTIAYGGLTALILCVTVWLFDVADTVATARDRAYSSACKTNLRAIAAAVATYQSQYGELPISIDVLKSNVLHSTIQAYCIRRFPVDGARQVSYVWSPSDDDICFDSCPHHIKHPYFIWRSHSETHVLTKSGSVETRRRWVAIVEVAHYDLEEPDHESGK